MFEEDKKIYFIIKLYNDIKNQKLPTRIIKLQETLTDTFSLPKNTKKIIIEDPITYKVITTIYIGIEAILKDIINGKECILVDKDFFYEKNITESLVEKRVLITFEEDGSIRIRKILNDEEIVFDSLYDAEYYLKTIREEVCKLNNETDNIKRLLKLNH